MTATPPEAHPSSARYGAVADFLHLHTTLPVGPLANYVFNVADAAIVAGVAVLLYESLRPRPASPAA